MEVQYEIAVLVIFQGSNHGHALGHPILIYEGDMHYLGLANDRRDGCLWRSLRFSDSNRFPQRARHTLS